MVIWEIPFCTWFGLRIGEGGAILNRRRLSEEKGERVTPELRG